MRILFGWLISALSLIIAANLVPGFTIEHFSTALIAAIILGLLNLTVRPIIFLLTLPVNILTLGLFSLILNGVIIWLLANIVQGVSVTNFGAAVMAALVLWVINWGVSFFLNSANQPVNQVQ